MEEFKLPNELPEIFRKDKAYELEDFLETRPQTKEDLYELAEEVAKDKTQVLFRTYHNLFYFQKEKSANSIATHIEVDLEPRLRATEENSDEYKKIGQQILIAKMLIYLVDKYDWQVVNNMCRTLEEVLV